MFLFEKLKYHTPILEFLSNIQGLINTVLLFLSYPCLPVMDWTVPPPNVYFNALTPIRLNLEIGTVRNEYILRQPSPSLQGSPHQKLNLLPTLLMDIYLQIHEKIKCLLFNATQSMYGILLWQPEQTKTLPSPGLLIGSGPHSPSLLPRENHCSTM